MALQTLESEVRFDMKKIGKIVALVLVFAMTINTTAFAAEPTTYISVSDKVNFSSYDDPVLAELIDKMGLTPEQVRAMDDQIRHELANGPVIERADVFSLIAAIVAIIVGVVNLMGTSYDAGQYAARRCEIDLGLTKEMYQANKTAIRIAMLPSLGLGVWGGPFCAGFDDYFTS